MAFYSNHLPIVEPDLLAWPPLRVYLTGTGAQWIPIADLMYLEGEASYTWLQWENGHRLLVPYTLKSFEAKLPSTWFIRLHRRHLVNRRFINRVDNDLNGPCVYLTTGMRYPVSRRRWPLVYQQMGCSKGLLNY